MNVVKLLLVKLGKVFLAIAGLIRRAFCCIRRRRRNSDTPLPITADVRHLATMPVQQFPGNEGTEVHNWTTWGEDESPSSITIIKNDTTPNASNTTGHTKLPSFGNNLYNRQHSSGEPEPEIDYFQGMIPAIRKTKKIIVKSQEDASDALSTRLSVEPQMVPVINKELEQWVDNEGSWEDSMNEDLVCDASAALKDAKILERERRAAENQRRKLEKDAMRVVKKDHLATKIS